MYIQQIELEKKNGLYIFRKEGEIILSIYCDSQIVKNYTKLGSKTSMVYWENQMIKTQRYIAHTACMGMTRDAQMKKRWPNIWKIVLPMDLRKSNSQRKERISYRIMVFQSNKSFHSASLLIQTSYLWHYTTQWELLLLRNVIILYDILSFLWEFGFLRSIGKTIFHMFLHLFIICVSCHNHAFSMGKTPLDDYHLVFSIIHWSFWSMYSVSFHLVIATRD